MSFFSLGLALVSLAPSAQEPDAQQPAFQDPAARLAASPRHHEWVEAKHGERTVRCFVAYPEVKAKVPAVLVIHENKGLTDWVRSVADELAAAGYVALAPDLLSGAGPESGHSDSFASADAATKAISALDPKQVLADLDAVLAFAQKVPASNGKVSVAGFCWGGSRAFEFAAHQERLTAAYVFYGSAPKEESAFAAMKCPVYGFYGENDARITAGLEATTAAMKAAEKTYEPVIYPGAGHGFLRAGEADDASPENKAAREAAWKRWKELLAR